MKWFVNYYQDNALSPSDRGVSYGDGVFETIKASPYGFYQLDDHLGRLSNGLDRLGMPLSNEALLYLRHFLFNVVLNKVDSLSVVKLIVTRGEGGRGYMPPAEPNHTILIGVGTAPDYQSQQSQGVALGVSPVLVNSNPYLAGLKHLNRLENVLAKQHLSDHCFEDVMLDSNGHVIECIQSNIFCFIKDTLMTPALTHSGVSGTYRKQIINSQSLYPVTVCDLTLQQLQSADDVFITNSLMGIVPVTSLQNHSFMMSDRTLQLQQLMQTKDVHDVL